MFSIKKGFTLIELMIVVVILGILMSTVLPKLTGAQARARDTARVADMGNISAALQVYYDDYGEFPSATADYNDGECLGTPASTATAAIGNYLKGGQVPMDPSAGANGLICAGQTPTGRFWYKPLSKSGVAKNAYVICADGETYQKANTLHTGFAGTTIKAGGAFGGVALDPVWTSFEEFATAVNQVTGDNMLTADATDQRYSMICTLNE